MRSFISFSLGKDFQSSTHLPIPEWLAEYSRSLDCFSHGGNIFQATPVSILEAAVSIASRKDSGKMPKA
jgi:hypothetical protein